MLQLSGAHTHANEHGHVGVPETGISHIHSHQHDAAGASEANHGSAHDVHDYEDARDVSFFELASGTLKLPLAILALILLLSYYPRARTLASTNFAYPVLSGRHTRWRPPLRAPPSLASI